MVQGKIILDKRSRAKKGHPIKIYISGDRKKKYISTGYFSEPDHWKDGPTRKHPNYQFLNSWMRRREYQLQEQIAVCNERGYDFDGAAEFIEAGGPDDREAEIARLKKRLRELEGASEMSLYDFWERLTDERKIAGKSTRAFDQTAAQIRNYAPEVSISEITPEWVEGFKRFKYADGCGDPGIHFYLVTLRTVYFTAVKRKLIPDENPFDGLIPQSVSFKRKVSLQRSDIPKLEAYAPGKYAGEKRIESTQRRIAIFLFQLYIGGHDLVDVANLRWENLQKGRVSFYRSKIKQGRPVLIDNVLLPQAQTIIDRYGTPKSNRVFSFIPDPALTEQYDNYRRLSWAALKRLSKKLGISPALKTKSPRYIFRTWAGEAGADILATMQIQGHRARGMTFVYQNRLPDRIVDRVLREILES